MADFDHIRPQYRPKVAQDFLDHLTPEGKWDFERFDVRNDYQLHLYALFLKFSGGIQTEIWATVYSLVDYIEPARRRRYVDDIVHSEIVGFPRVDGSIELLPAQNVG